jgi:hypothetical protein
MGASKTLGIIGLATGWVVPLSGVALGIIGLCLKKEKGREQRDIALNTISIVVGVVAWAFWWGFMSAI